MQIMTHAVPEKTYYWTMFYAIIVRHPMGSRAINSVGAYIQRWLCTLYPTAQSIQYGDMQQVFSDMQEMITHSTYQRYSPILYPWGYPLLLFPCVALFGINYFAFKIVGVICLVGAFIFLYYHPILSKERFRMSVLLVLALLTGNHILLGVC